MCKCKCEKKVEDKDFDELYEDYSDYLEKQTHGLVESNKAEFMKMLAFFQVVDYEMMLKIIRALK